MNFINLTEDNWKNIWEKDNFSIFLFHENGCTACQSLIDNLSEYDFTIYKLDWQEIDAAYEEFRLGAVPWLFIIKDKKIYYETGGRYINLENFFRKYIKYDTEIRTI
jgi:thioredoxin-related protein